MSTIHRTLIWSLLLFGGATVPLFAEKKVGGPAAGEWQVHERKDAHFAVSLPPGWQPIELDPARIDASLSEIAKVNPDLGQAFGPQAQSLMAAGFKFFAADLEVDVAKVGFATNLNVLAEKVPAQLAIEDYLRANAAQMQNLSSIKDLAPQMIEIDGRKAGRLDYRMIIDPSSGLEVAIIQVYALTDGSSLIFTFTTLPAQLPHYRPIFDRMIARIRVLH